MRLPHPADRHPGYEELIARHAGDNEYARHHLPRYLHTLRHMPDRTEIGTGRIRVLELGTSLVLPPILLDRFGFAEVEVSHFDPGALGTSFDLPLDNDPEGRSVAAFSIDLESDAIPRPDSHYDLVLCLEVIEHLERDPMFMLVEINRVLRTGGLLYLSTPNVTSARNVHRILQGYAPHFFMKYPKTRELYRHNIEYDPHQLLALASAAGFEARRFWTQDCFEMEVPSAMALLRKHRFPVQHRGDNMFFVGAKISAPLERHPSCVYF